MEQLLRDLLISGVAGSVAGLIAWGGLKRDVEWLKAGMTRLENHVFGFGSSRAGVRSKHDKAA